jgi:aspartyl-tRNA(Asn)/glutamyl-tRNA(Gln) amidotransferase subunit A
MFDAAVASGKNPSVKGLKVGRIRQLDTDGFQPSVRQRYHETLELLSTEGAEIIDIDAPHFDYAVSAYYLILPAEASSNLAKFDSVRFGLRVTPEGGNATVEDVMAATREAGFGDEVKRRIILGTYALSAGYFDAYYGSAQKVRTLIQQDFATAFSQVDVLITPSAPHTAFRLGEQLDDPLAMYANDLTTIPANLAGVPGLALPIGLDLDTGLPIGLQLMAPAHADQRLFVVGGAVEALVNDAFGGAVWSRVPDVAVGGAK